ncbi:MAG: hypothetical protein IM658_08815 [Phenylobacterium sp.]|nr:hypothetical protein [Phenylobacterium sp.]MCA6283773.1 hypothetical protein [Phenylobacterium sp.]MCA6335733.1 hypothetical protein [Phenylobacterium sp.]
MTDALDAWLDRLTASSAPRARTETLARPSRSAGLSFTFRIRPLQR